MAKNKKNKREDRSQNNLSYQYPAPTQFPRQVVNGVSVNQDTVLGAPAVWAGVNIISRFVCKLPCSVYRRTDGNGRKEDKNHAAYNLVRFRANELTSSRNFFLDMTAATVMHGNGYALIDRDINGVALSMTQLDSRYVMPDMSRGFLVYRATVFLGNQSKIINILPEDIIHIRGLGLTGSPFGKSVIDLMAEQFGGTLAMQKHSTDYFNNGCFSGGAIEYDTIMIKDKAELQATKEALRQEYLGLGPRGLMLIQGGHFNPFQINHDQMQFLESRQFDVAAVANVFLLPAHLLNSSINSGYNSMEMLTLDNLDRMDYWLLTWEDELREKLLKENEKANDTRFFEFDRNCAVKMDRNSKINWIVTQANNGLLNRDEARDYLNEEPLPDDLGQDFYIASNLIKLTNEPPEPPPMQAAAPPNADPTELQQQTDAQHKGQLGETNDN